MIDDVNHPDHYTQGSIEAIEYIEDSLGSVGFSFYLEGNIKKYLHRWRYSKDGSKTKDLKKAIWYLNRLLEHERNE